MDSERARRDAEALRYRLHVRLGHVLREAKGARRDDVAREAERLRAELNAIVIDDTEALTGAALKRLEGIRPSVAKLQTELGLADYDHPLFPKWLRLVVFALPVVLLVGLVAFVIERRRRKKEIGEEALAALDRERDASSVGSGVHRR